MQMNRYYLFLKELTLPIFKYFEFQPSLLGFFPDRIQVENADVLRLV